MGAPEILRLQRTWLASGAMREPCARREALRALSAGLERHEAALLEALHADLGKTGVQGFTTELLPVRLEISHALRHLKRWMKPSRGGVPPMAFPGRARVVREACGAVLIAGPWNYPVQLLLAPLVGALAAGCSAVLKPSELAPHSAEALGALVKDVFAPELVTLCQGGRECMEALQREAFDHVFFTGGATAGRQVLAAAARTLTPVTLELGGKCPAMVFSGGKPADGLLKRLDVIARRIAWGKYLNAGQTCVAPDHVLVEAALYEPLLDALRRAFDSFGLEEHGRMVSRSHFERVRSYLSQGRIVHGGRCDEAALKIEPAILTDIPAGAAVMEEEIFGPVLPVIPCSDCEDALRQVRARPAPLAIYAFSTDPALKRSIERGTHSGGVCFNDTVVQITGPALPFGGVGASGIGRYHGRAGFEAFTRQRTILSRPLLPDFAYRYPPAKVGIDRLKQALKFFRLG